MYDDTVADFYDPRYDGDDPDYGDDELEADPSLDFEDHDDLDEFWATSTPTIVSATSMPTRSPKPSRNSWRSDPLD